jgi:hypothetical protein
MQEIKLTSNPRVTENNLAFTEAPPRAAIILLGCLPLKSWLIFPSAGRL